MNLENIIKQKNTTIIDVRTPEEFKNGNAKGSINIPMQEIPKRLDEIKKLNQPLVLCCASGGRSGQVHSYLLQQNIECYNGGSWMDVVNYQLKTI